MREWLQGYVMATAQGGMPERFLNLADEAGIVLWNTRRDGIALVFCCPAADYRRLRPVARRCGARMTLCKRKGLPFLCRPFQKRWGLVVGAVVTAILLQLLSSRIWMISVDGNRRVSSEEILSVLQPLGVTIGGDFDAVDIPTVKLTALQQLDGIRWLSVSKHGCHVRVQVAEREPTVPLTDNAPANIVSICDGVVVSIRVTDGTATVKVGDAVTVDTLLISGVTDSTVGPILRRAQGEIIARTTVTHTATVPLTEDRPVAAPTTYQAHTLLFFGQEIPWFGIKPKEGEYTAEQRTQYLSANGKDLPIGVRTVTYTMRETETITRTESEAKDEALRRLSEQLSSTERTMTVEDKTISYTTNENAVTATVTYTGIQSIGVAQPIG